MASASDYRLEMMMDELRRAQDPVSIRRPTNQVQAGPFTVPQVDIFGTVSDAYNRAKGRREAPALRQAAGQQLGQMEQAEQAAAAEEARRQAWKRSMDEQRLATQGERVGLERTRAEQAGRRLTFDEERAAERDRQWALDYELEKDKLAASAGAAHAKKVEGEVAALSKAMEDLAPLESALGNVEEMVASYGEKDIPGAGFLEGAPGVLGKTLRGLQDVGSAAMGTPGRAQENFSKIEQLMATVRRNQIGSQQTRTELEKVLQQIGQSGWEEENVFREGVDAVRQHVEAEKANIYARAGDDAVKLYETRTGRAQSGGLTPEEQVELEALEAEFGGQ